MNDIAKQFETDDLNFTYRVTRAWLHAIRDRLPVVDAAHLGARLPELWRGVFYEGWEPAKVPMKYGSAEFLARFAENAGIARTEIAKAAHAVSTAFDEHLSGHLAVVLQHFPEDLRAILRPG